ncbi:MAG: glycosyltransferase [Rhodobiaceae bacterium]|nr:glycosyltransferase [Rhodobiaceae bacterium]
MAQQISTRDEKHVRLGEIMGCPCAVIDDEAAASGIVETLVEAGTGGYSVAINAEKIVRFQKDPQLRKIIEQSSLPTPDGIGATLGLRLLTGLETIKVNLPVVTLELSAQKNYRVYLCGASTEVNEKLVAVVRQKYPTIHLVGHCHGFVPEEEMVRRIVEAAPQVTLLALGSPKQELLAGQLRERVPGMFTVCCGGAFDVISGTVKRAPDFFVDNGIEWLYRLAQNPRRWRRQLALPKFVGLLLAWKLGCRGSAKV